MRLHHHVRNVRILTAAGWLGRRGLSRDRRIDRRAFSGRPLMTAVRRSNRTYLCETKEGVMLPRPYLSQKPPAEKEGRKTAPKMLLASLCLAVLLAWAGRETAPAVNAAAVVPADNAVRASADIDAYFHAAQALEREQSALDAQIGEWIGALAEHAEYAHWRGAEWDKYPIGAGMHGWVVILRKNGEEIGYLVVGAKEDGTFALTEYGDGPYPLFSGRTLYRTMRLEGWIDPDIGYEKFVALLGERKDETAAIEADSYYDPGRPLAAVWRVRHQGATHIIDGKTGEVYPLEALEFPSSSPDLDRHETIQTGRLSELLRIDAFDPYARVSWMTAEPIAPSWNTIRDAMNGHKPLVYVAQPFGSAVTLPLAVTGIERWEAGSERVVLDQDGPRSLALPALNASGEFYPLSGDAGTAGKTTP